MPEQDIPQQKTNWILYAITIIISFVIMYLLIGNITLVSSFLPLESLTIVYIFVSITSLIMGLITGFILNKITKTNKAFLIGNLAVSILSAIVISIQYFIIQNLTSQFQSLAMEENISAQAANGGLQIMVSLFSSFPNPIIASLLILILFNIVPVILFIKRKNKLNN